MDYKQFIQILKDEKSGPDALSMLNEFVNEFPYFQTAQSLLAREMNLQQHVRYERQLKVASAYSADRKALYNLIHPKKTNIFSVEPVIEHPHLPEEPVIAEKLSDNLFEVIIQDEIIPPAEPGIEIHEIVAEIPPVSINSSPGFEIEIETESDEITEELPPADPHEIIRKRLNEILGLHSKDEIKNEPIQEIKEAEEIKKEVAEKFTEQSVEIVVPPIKKEEIPHVAAQIFEREPEQEIIKEEKDIIDKIADESLHAVDVIDRGELEYALEASLIQSLEKLPLIEKAKPAEEIPTAVSGGSFFDWLKSKTAGDFGKIEEVHAYDEPVSEIQAKPDPVKNETNALIDRFIKEEPKIVVSKTEFYSPSIQAKKSITDHEDIVSETLAKIYLQQGNVLKARSMYEKLGLLYPEKKAYFAALIFQIDKDINQHNKQDL